MVQVIQAALALSTCDGTVTEEQTRTPEKQQQKVDQGVSTTTHSHHVIGYTKMPLAAGCSGAIDVVPYVNGAALWDWNYCAQIAWAVRQASIQLDIPVTWGGAWGYLLSDAVYEPPAGTDPAAHMLNVSHAYNSFPDGPHFHLGEN
jgi:peptidoglycan L-alanyl-D-glutamate endopeptidase CwlK